MIIEKVFEADEMTLIRPRAAWTRNEILNTQGIFYLKNITEHLAIDSVQIKKRALALRKKGKSSYQVMGVKKVWNHWMVRMKIFAPYYRRYLKPKFNEVGADWNCKTLLSKKDTFLLSAVCKLVPYQDHQFRYKAKKGEADLGIWKDKQLGLFLVDMKQFSKWMEDKGQ